VKNKFLRIALSGLLFSFVIFPATSFADISRLSFGVGQYDVINTVDSAADFRVEYRLSEPMLFDLLTPWVGLEVTSDETVWGGGGLLFDYPIGNRWYLVPSLGVGLYDRGRSALRLGHVIEFRSQLELAYQFDNLSRVAFAISHLSNASLSSDNPGVEVLTLYWQIPF